MKSEQALSVSFFKCKKTSSLKLWNTITHFFHLFSYHFIRFFKFSIKILMLQLYDLKSTERRCIKLRVLRASFTMIKLIVVDWYRSNDDMKRYSLYINIKKNDIFNQIWFKYNCIKVKKSFTLLMLWLHLD